MENKKQIKYCDFCETKNATCICFKCNKYFCDNCFDIIHKLKEKQKTGHKQEKLDIFIPIELKCQKHPNDINDLFCINDKEFCCTRCHFKNLHEGHKLIEIYDEDSLNRENLDVKDEKERFNIISQRIIGLKDKIEIEIKKINQQFDKTINELKSSYQKKYEILKNEENKLRETLENKVTETKEQLELYLTEINENIRISDRINKGINKFMEEKKSMIQILSYISKINTSEKSMKILEKQFMKTIKFKYEEKLNIINYEEIFFSGIIIPENITIKEINKTSFKIFWSIDQTNLNNIDKNLIKHKVEIKPENEKDFIGVYEGKETYCFIRNLQLSTTYEVRICSIYKDLIGTWSKIQKVTTLIDSSILIKSNRALEFLEIIYHWIGSKKIELLFRSTRDGMNAKIFHKKCDNQGATICFIKNEKGHIFGGYTSISWTSETGNKTDPKAFLFTLSNIYNIKPTKFVSMNCKNEVYHFIEFGPIFGKDGLDLKIQPYLNSANSNFPKSFQDVSGKGYSLFSSEENNPNFGVKEIEVFKIY